MQTIEDCGPCSESGKDAAIALAESFCDGVGNASPLEPRQWGGIYKGHPIERWFANHPEYLKNHPGWLNRHPDWAGAHGDFIKQHLGHAWHPQPPKYPHHPHHPGHPTPPTYPHPPKPTPTVYS